MLKIHSAIQTTKSKNYSYGHNVIGVAASALNLLISNLRYGIILLADSDNTVNIWIGKSNVTADNNATTGGFPLIPGSSIELPFSDMQDLYGISTDADQNLVWMGI